MIKRPAKELGELMPSQDSQGQKMNQNDMLPQIVYLGLGSNMGDRKRQIELALEKIAELPHTSLQKTSSVIETKAVGFEGKDFLNCCCRIETSLAPIDLLRSLKQIEMEMGREMAKPEYDEKGHRIYKDRPIDIDILLYGELKMNEENLTIPHPRMQERDFVMIPLKEIKI